jgi:hypothetical protein
VQLIQDETIEEHDLKERLFVAEKVMKSLFERNKQLEDGAVSIQNELQRSPSVACQCQKKDELIRDLEKELANVKLVN